MCIRDSYEIVPEDPYTDADLAYYTNGRADREQNDPSARPAISGGVENMADYDVIFLGYPFWHGQAPRILSTFLESYDLTGKPLSPSALPTPAASAPAIPTSTPSPAERTGSPDADSLVERPAAP